MEAAGGTLQADPALYSLLYVPDIPARNSSQPVLARRVAAGLWVEQVLLPILSGSRSFFCAQGG